MKLHELAYFTDNVAEMTDFYRALLNQEPVHASADMAIFMQDGVKLFIHRTYEPQEEELPPENHTAFLVDDVDKACERLTAVGLILTHPPQDYYWGRSAYLRDADGHLIEITASD